MRPPIWRCASQRHITPNATEEIKFDGYRAEAMKSDGNLFLLSRRQKSFSKQFPLIHEALADPPANTVVDGEIVALDEAGKPDFNLLQNFRSAAKSINYFVFDLLVLEGQDLTSLPPSERRHRMRSLKFSSPLVRFCEQFDTSAEEMIAAVRQLGLEGVIGKRKDSKYEAGKRTGSWIKHRINRGQELVIGGYFPGPHGFDSIILGYYKGDDLMYVARTRNGFVPATRRQVFSKLKNLVIEKCPFVNLPDTRKSRFGEERLRHSKFVGLRDDKEARQVVKESAG